MSPRLLLLRLTLALLLPLSTAFPVLARAADAGASPGGLCVGIGLGWGAFDRGACPECPGRGGLSGTFDLAAPVSRQVRVGLLATAWTRREDESTRAAFGAATATVTLFVAPRGGLYFKLGAGVAGYSIDGGLETGPGLNAAAGFEARPTGWLGVGPYAAWSWGRFDRFSSSLLQVGISVLAK